MQTFHIDPSDKKSIISDNLGAEPDGFKIKKIAMAQ